MASPNPSTSPSPPAYSTPARKSFTLATDPMTHWIAANLGVAQDPAGNLKPARDKSTERIDASSP